MVRLSVLSKANNRIYWVLKKVSPEKLRKSDFTAERLAIYDDIANKYGKEFFSRMTLEGHICFWEISGKQFVLVNDRIPLTGSKEGFYKIIQRKYHIKFATTSDPTRSWEIKCLVTIVGTELHTPYREGTRQDDQEPPHQSAFKRFVPLVLASCIKVE